jgi:hypothetical protein
LIFGFQSNKSAHFVVLLQQNEHSNKFESLKYHLKTPFLKVCLTLVKKLTLIFLMFFVVI